MLEIPEDQIRKSIESKVQSGKDKQNNEQPAQRKTGWRVHPKTEPNEQQAQGKTGWKMHPKTEPKEQQAQGKTGWRVHPKIEQNEGEKTSKSRWDKQNTLPVETKKKILGLAYNSPEVLKDSLMQKNATELKGLTRDIKAFLDEQKMYDRSSISERVINLLETITEILKDIDDFDFQKKGLTPGITPAQKAEKEAEQAALRAYIARMKKIKQEQDEKKNQSMGMHR